MVISLVVELLLMFIYVDVDVNQAYFSGKRFIFQYSQNSSSVGAELQDTLIQLPLYSQPEFQETRKDEVAPTSGREGRFDFHSTSEVGEISDKSDATPRYPNSRISMASAPLRHKHMQTAYPPSHHISHSKIQLILPSHLHAF
jgi:hypothetical protein